MNRNNSAARQYDAYNNVYKKRNSYARQIAKKPVRKRYPRTTVYTHQRHRTRALSISYARGVGILLVYGVLMVFLCAKGSMLNYDIIHLKDELNNLETENKRIAFEIQEKSSLDRIADIAVTQLGMVTPDMTKAYMTENIQPAQLSMPEVMMAQEEDTETSFEKLYGSLKTLGNQALKSSIDFLASY